MYIDIRNSSHFLSLWRPFLPAICWNILSALRCLGFMDAAIWFVFGFGVVHVDRQPLLFAEAPKSLRTVVVRDKHICVSNIDSAADIRRKHILIYIYICSYTHRHTHTQRHRDQRQTNTQEGKLGGRQANRQTNAPICPS